MRILVVAPHPDDEVLGMGGTIALLVDSGHHVTVATMTTAVPLYSEEEQRRLRSEQARAHNILGVKDSLYADLPTAGVSGIPCHEVNAKCLAAVESAAPDWLFLPFALDLHRDHRDLFQAFMIAARPVGPGRALKRIACYETVSETHWAAPYLETSFQPQWFVDISSTLERKLSAVREFESQMRPFPDERSPEALEALARSRGTSLSIEAAEAFVIVREKDFPMGSSGPGDGT